MNGLDTSLEALAFNPINLSHLFTNLWALTFGVIITIVISLRHLRRSTSCAAKMPRETVTVKPVDEIVLPRQPVAVKTNSNEELVRSDGKKCCFTVYYEEGCCEGDDVDGGDYEEEESETVVEKWTVEMRGGGELGWYDFQDRNVIDGSVVRLWDSGSGSGLGPGSPRRCRSRLNSLTYYGFSTVYSDRVNRILGGFE